MLSANAQSQSESLSDIAMLARNKKDKTKPNPANMTFPAKLPALM